MVQHNLKCKQEKHNTERERKKTERNLSATILQPNAFPFWDFLWGLCSEHISKPVSNFPRRRVRNASNEKEKIEWGKGEKSCLIQKLDWGRPPNRALFLSCDLLLCSIPNGPIPASFSSFPHYDSNLSWKPGPQDGRRRRIHWAMAATQSIPLFIRKNIFFLKKLSHSYLFSLFSSFQYSWHLTFNINLCRLLHSNWGPLESEAIALPTEPQPLPKYI